MHSGCGAVAETRHVYLRGADVDRRLGLGLPTRVLEIGFGSGMAWLLTADHAVSRGAPLVYEALDIELPPVAVIRQLELDRYLESDGLLEAYCQWRAGLPARPAASEQASWTFQFRTASLRLRLVDAIRWCELRATAPSPPPAERFDAVYFDPYAPEASPQLWRADVFRAIGRQLSDHGKLVTYCVSRLVRDELSAAGFAVRRVPGPPGGKREVLIASLSPQE